jgi:glutamine amidotransferase
MITIVDYGMGNLGSVKNMFKKIGEVSIVSSKKEDIEKATKILLPGVGAFDNAMKNLNDLDLIEIIKKKVLVEKTPIMGICLGMQLLTRGSEEGHLEGFGFIDAYAKKFDFCSLENTLPIPHMGWNKVYLQKESKLLQENQERENRFYFVHSYAVNCENKEDILTITNYGYKFVSSFEKNNIIGCQFHPEKSHKFGMKLFKNFVEKY